jgi:hypothetical protein
MKHLSNTLRLASGRFLFPLLGNRLTRFFFRMLANKLLAVVSCPLEQPRRNHRFIAVVGFAAGALGISTVEGGEAGIANELTDPVGVAESNPLHDGLGAPVVDHAPSNTVLAMQMQTKK